MKRILFFIIAFIASELLSYQATIFNHTPWTLRGRPTRAWSKMEDRVIEPHEKESWDSGIALLTGVTLDLEINPRKSIKEALRETYVGRMVDITYHIFCEPFLEEINIIKKTKLILIRESSGTKQRDIYPGGIIKESKDIDLYLNKKETAPKTSVTNKPQPNFKQKR